MIINSYNLVELKAPILAIDPGVHIGWAISDKHGHITNCWTSKSNNLYSLSQLRQIIKDDVKSVIIERAGQYRPLERVKSLGKNDETRAAICSMFSRLGIPVQEIPSDKWSPKADNIGTAICGIYPQIDVCWTTHNHNGKSSRKNLYYYEGKQMSIHARDAAMLADWFWQQREIERAIQGETNEKAT